MDIIGRMACSSVVCSMLITLLLSLSLAHWNTAINVYGNVPEAFYNGSLLNCQLPVKLAGLRLQNFDLIGWF